jgi:maltose alpha-D-glucosyltransferase/alpha-amylase
MRIYDRGIRRRLPPMLKGDLRRLKLSHSLLMTMPGTPVLRYGEEIGMGEDLSLDERNSTRTPMQWSNAKGAGFSRVDRQDMIRPVVNKGKFSYTKVNVADQQRDADSLLSVTERMIRIRKENPGIGCGKWAIVETGQPQVLAHRCDWRGRTIVALHNFSDSALQIEMDLADQRAAKITEVLSDAEYDPPNDPSTKLNIEGYGYRWFRIDSKAS